MGDFTVVPTHRRMIFYVCVLTGVALSVVCSKCPVYPSLPNFDIDRMSGVWYEVERSFYLMEMAASCTRVNVTISDRGQMLVSVNTVNRWNGESSTTSGVGVPSSPGSSVFRYRPARRLPYLLARLLPGAGLYYVLFTDYDQFAILWSCTSLAFLHTDRVWVLGRSRDLPVTLRAHVYAILTDLRLDPDRLLVSKNTQCSNNTGEYRTNPNAIDVYNTK